MRAIILLLPTVTACGPIYPPPAQQQPQPTQASPSGPPGGGDPWAEGQQPSAPEPAPPGEPQPQPQPQPAEAPRPQPTSKLPADVQTLLDSHNEMRAKHCAPPLTWSAKLTAYAQNWASSLRDRGCKFEHSRGNKFGENLAGATAGVLDGSGVTKMWYDEVKLYNFKSGGFSMETGHFTQLVWRGTTQVGCAKAACNGMELWVCEYDPPGNVETLYRANVLPTSCR